MSKPMFSIIMATYNRGFIIDKAIKSVLEQDFKNWELIIIDDGSTDNTFEIVKPFLKDKRIRYIKLPTNKGVNYARNRGLKVATGSYYLPLDSDNQLLKGALKEISEEIERKYTDLYFFRVKTMSGKIISTPVEGFLEAKNFVCEKVKGEYLPVCKLSVLKKYSFIESINGGEGIIWKKISLQVQKIYFSPKEVLLYNDLLSDRLSGRNCKYYNTLKMYLREIKEFWKYYIVNCPILLLNKIFRRLIVYFVLSILIKNKKIKHFLCSKKKVY